MNTDAEPGMRQPPVRSGQVSTAFVHLLGKYGASTQLLRKVGEVAEDAPGSGPDADVNYAAEVTRVAGPHRRLGVLFARIAGADPDLLESLPNERARYQTLGITLAVSAAAAMAVAGTALVLVGTKVVVAVVFAFLYGALIFSLDRWFAVADLGGRQPRWRQLLRSVPRLIVSALLGIVMSTPIILAVFRSAIDAQLAIGPGRWGRTPGMLDRLEALDQLSAAHPAVQLARWSVAALIVAMDAAPVLAALALRRRPSAYEIAASVQERYFPAERELTVLRLRARQQGAVTQPQSDLARELAAIAARMEQLSLEIARSREQNSAEIINLAARRDGIEGRRRPFAEAPATAHSGRRRGAQRPRREPDVIWERAEASLRSLHDRYLHAHGPYDSLTLATVVGYAQSLVEVGKADEAEAQLSSNVKHLRQVFGPQSSLYLRAVFLLGQASAQLGKYEAARERYEIAFAGQRDLLGEGHPETLLSQFELGVALKLVGDDGRAQEMFRAVRRAVPERVGSNTDLYARSLAASSLAKLPAWLWRRIARSTKSSADSQGMQSLIDQLDQYGNETKLEELEQVLDQLAERGSSVA